MKDVVSCFVVAVFCFLLLDSMAWGAYLQEVNKNLVQIPDETNEEIKKQGTCEADGFAQARSEVEDDFAEVNAISWATVSGDETCTAISYSSAVAIAELELIVQPDQNDEIGDCILISYASAYNLTADTNGTGYDAKAFVGGGDDFRTPVQIVLDEGNRSCAVLQYGPKTVKYGHDENFYSGSFIARIGDKIVLKIATRSLAEGSGVGGAFSMALGASISIKAEDLGPCDAPSPCEPAVPKPVPAIGWYGSGILVILLSAAAVLFMRRRRLHR